MTDLAWSEQGSGPALLWGHGLLQSRDAEDRRGPIRWPGLELGCRVIRWDARGHGESPTPTTSRECEWPELARDALALADELDLDRFAIGGASMGAATAIWVAALAPERVTSVVLAIPPTAWARRAPTRLLYGTAGAIGSAIPVDDVAARGAVLQGAGASDLPAEEILRDLDIPTLVLAWRFDPIHPVSTAQRLHEMLPAAELHITSRPGDTSRWVPRMRGLLSS